MSEYNNRFICLENSCTGCGLCISKCPQGAINWYIEADKRKVAIINSEYCLNCNLCKKLCPQNIEFRGHLATETYASWLIDKEKLEKSSSGGIARALSEQWIKDGGIVFGAAWNGNRVEHIAVSKIEELDRLSGSKYVQSDTENAFIELTNYQKNNTSILFIGTPCQVAAAKQCCSKTYSKLVTIDLICHGVPPSEYLESYFNELNIKTIKNFSCRSRDPQNYYCVKITDDADNITLISKNDSSYIKAFINNIILRENCYNCRYACPERISDITIGDYWKVNRLQLPPKTPKYISSTTIHTKEGEMLWGKIKNNIEFHKRAFQEVIKGNKNLRQPSVKNIKRNEFINNYNNNFSITFKKIHNYNIHNFVITYIKEKIKNILKKIISLSFNNPPSKKTNIGVITLPLKWLLTNYGSLFQHYALRETLKKLGYNPFRYEYAYSSKDEYVYFVTNKLKAFYNVIIHNLIHPCNLLKNLHLEYIKTKKDILFRDFFISNFGAIVELDNNECKQYIVGSDQIWTNPNNFTTLNIFNKNTKKIAYAASADWEYARSDLNWKYYMSEVLPLLDHISLREDIGVNIVNNLLKMNKAIKTVDPVLLLKKDDYNRILDSKIFLDKETIFCYFLNISNSDQLNINVLEKLANQLKCNLKIVGIQGAENYIPHKYIIYLSPLDFLRCYRDAKYIITNSFHGTIFSMIFNKSFVTLEQFEKPGRKQNERIINLLKSYNLLNRFILQNNIKNIENIIKCNINWDIVNFNVNANKDSSLTWLKNALSN